MQTKRSQPFAWSLAWHTSVDAWSIAAPKFVDACTSRSIGRSTQSPQKWDHHIEGKMDAGTFVDGSEAERTTLAEALERYRREIVPQKRHPDQEERSIDRWPTNDLAFRTLANTKVPTSPSTETDASRRPCRKHPPP